MVFYTKSYTFAYRYVHLSMQTIIKNREKDTFQDIVNALKSHYIDYTTAYYMKIRVK
jgi:hypothetical protein